MDLKREDIKALPVWIRFLDLDVKFLGSASLSKIGSILGIPLKIDKCTRGKSMVRYARILIKVSLDGPFPCYVEFFNKNGVLVKQQVDMNGSSQNVCTAACLAMRGKTIKEKKV